MIACVEVALSKCEPIGNYNRNNGETVSKWGWTIETLREGFSRPF